MEGIVADVSCVRGMNHLCDEVLAKTDRLDCLINNAGEATKSMRMRAVCSGDNVLMCPRFIGIALLPVGVHGYACDDVV